MHSQLFLTCTLLLCVPACGFAGVGQPTMLATVTQPLNPTLTRTPYHPDGLVLTQSALTLQPTTDEAPQPAEPLPRPIGQVSLLLLGSDQRPAHSDFRTDVIVLLSIRNDGSLSLVSFPRDLYVYLPGRSMSRINAAFEYGGFELLASTLEHNFGLRPDRHVLTNFDGFRSIVDGLGGVDVSVGLALSDARTGYPDGFTVDSGLVHMNGETALWYVRSRGSTDDFDRLRRAQEMLVAIGLKLLSLDGLAHVSELYQAYQSSVFTDLTLDDTLDILPILKSVDSSRVDRYAIAPPSASPWIEPSSGAYYLIPDRTCIRSILQQAIGIP